MTQIIIQNPVLGGISDGKYLGIANSLHKIIGFDLHGEPGVIKVHQKLKKESATTIDSLPKNAVVCSNGETYLFSSTSGKIWRRKSNATYELAYTTVPTSGAAGCSGAKEYNGYIYWATQNYLHRIAIADALTATWVPGAGLNWQAFTNGDADYHPMEIVNGVLYIGDKNYIAQVDDATFSAKANDIVLPFRICALGQRLTEILYGSVVNSIVRNVPGGRWNTWSDSYNSEDYVPEPGINCFMKTDNYNLVNAGRKGNFYEYDGTFFVPSSKRIPGDWGNGKEAMVYPEASENDGNILRFGLSQLAGAPTECGIYGYGAYSPLYPKILTMDYPISTGNMGAIDIGAVFFIGSDIFVAWADRTNPLAPVYGVDVIDNASKYAAAYFDTRVIAIERETPKDFYVEINYRSLPTGCDLEIWKSVNNAAYAKVDTINDAKSYKKYTKVKITDANMAQFRFKAIVSGNDAPEIESALISY